MPDVRKGQIERAMTREEFRERYYARYADPAYRAAWDAVVRTEEVQNGNHLESYALVFPELRVIQPHAHKAFDLLVDHVEKNAPLPPSQCIPKDGSISATPTQPGHCEKLSTSEHDPARTTACRRTGAGTRPATRGPFSYQLLTSARPGYVLLLTR